MTRCFLLVMTLASTACMETGIRALHDESAGYDDPVLDTADSEPDEQEEEVEEGGDEGHNDVEDRPEDDLPPEEEEPAPEDDCDHTSDLIYVIDRTDQSLYLFDPTDLQFDFVGELDCGIWAGTPGSMSVARDGKAYVRYSDNTVYAVDLSTMACEETDYAQGSFGSFGMGFATNSSDTWRDQLYVANHDRLARIDTTSWSMDILGSLPSQSELTGNADGELWAILPLETPAKLVRLQTSDASIVETLTVPSMPSAMDIDVFAFATWGGDFWVFIRTYGMGQSTNVYRVSESGATSLVAENTGMDVVGAGVSTCAPTD